MADLTPKQKRRCLDFANKVADLAQQSPDRQTRRELYGVAKSVRIRYGFSDAEKESVVLDRVRDGASTVGDLVKETGFPRQDISEITKRLADMRMVSIRPLNDGRPGRPSALITPLG